MLKEILAAIGFLVFMAGMFIALALSCELLRGGIILDNWTESVYY